MAKIPFDIKYRPQIESGEYKIETENGFPATILDWSFRKDSGSPYICVKITRDGTDNAFLYSEDGKRAVHRVKDNDLIIITPESEDDRIRKFLKHATTLDAANELFQEYGVKHTQVVAWLEKQKEQKPTECLKPEKDCWYVCVKDFYGGGKKQSSKGDLVQAKGGMYVMVKDDISEWFRKAYYDEIKPADWNEEDEKMIRCITNRIESDIQYGDELIKAYGNKEIAWIKSLRPQPKQEWSEEDEKMAYFVNQFLGYHENADPTAKSCKKWFNNRIKSLRSQLHYNTVEWSEEDEKMLEVLISNYNFLSKKYRDEEKDFFCSLSIVRDDLDMSEWLEKRLKFLRPQSHWKPSDEQLRPLGYAIDYFKKKRNDTTYLESLYNDLKKL